MELLWLLCCPLSGALVLGVLGARTWAPELNVGFSLASFLAACALTARVVTDGNLLRGVRFTGDGVLTQSVVMTSSTPKVRFIETTHLENKPDVKVRFR